MKKHVEFTNDRDYNSVLYKILVNKIIRLKRMKRMERMERMERMKRMKRKKIKILDI